MNYKITISNPGNHIHNPLLALAGREYATREAACEAIYTALYDVIDGSEGCEMVDRTSAPKAYWVLSGEGERGTWNRIVTNPDGIKQHLYDERCGGDRFARAVSDIYETIDGAFAGTDPEDGIPVTAPFEAADDVGDANDVREVYTDMCHAYILREGYATEDGVTATVEES